MIQPTPAFDPLFKQDGIPFQAKMIQYIQREFADVLGTRAVLLKRPGGLELLARLCGLPVSERVADKRAA